MANGKLQPRQANYNKWRNRLLIPAKGPCLESIYETALAQTIEAFPGTVEGSHTAAVCVVSTREVDPQTKRALSASFNKLGYNASQTCWIALTGAYFAAEQHHEILLQTIEALDPIACVATDSAATEELSSAYHRPLELDTCAQLLGRSVCCFGDFAALLSNNSGKQRAWRSLRALEA